MLTDNVVIFCGVFLDAKEQILAAIRREVGEKFEVSID